MKFIQLLFLIVSITLTSAMARADDSCPPLPQISMWSNVTHASMTEYIKNKHGGDWESYIDKWKNQLDLLMDVYARNSEVVIRSKNLRLKGETLAEYINNVRKRLAVTRCLAKSTPAKTQTADTSKGRALSKSAGCGACHGEEGIGNQPTIPNLAGQQARYLSLQLRRLRIGKGRPLSGDIPNAMRFHKDLEAVIAQLKNQDIEILADYFASLSCKSSGQPPIASTLPQTKGCALCHGIKGRGRNLSIPNLAGQPWKYLAKQLHVFKATANNEHVLDDVNSRFHPIMSDEARKLTNGEIKELSMYYSGLKCE
ncbi:MAG: c-type cytochrome [Rhodospirillaceae bacterium]|mgnify:FL=1|jgi:cytochrome c553|nr:c-type cytochrome [Rhodospirillales bacterium]MBT3904261.1 c-type cytochrome [Rhodospirillaceae bacterium]MBT4700412.1 c-type cytochrome [Rhodospirillaceae bacterium]MBT5033388.1 c-type cytochrome [Rhodospirillaceae bacterium]MBT6219232.1 c-type cytochrome [Rhodospirillaceae bacterium]